MLQKISRVISRSITLALIGVTVHAAHAQNTVAVERLVAENSAGQVSINAATGTARFVRLSPGLATTFSASAGKSKNDVALSFVRQHAQAFGLRVGSADLELVKTDRDSLGQTHLTYAQIHAGVPVFAATLKAHFDTNDRLSVISGTLVPDVAVSSAPGLSAKQAVNAALSFVEATLKAADVSAQSSRLVIFREGLAKGVPGDNHLAYEVEVGNGADVREFVYVNAHTGKFIDQITGTTDVLNRRAFDAEGAASPGPNYPDMPFWVEGQAFPTGNVEADNMIAASQESYDLFANAFGRDSFDGAGATMESVFNRGNGCPNASWNGQLISFCPGLTTDDITGHEWGHAYTQYTDGLIYQWQPGALSEHYSDVVGETIDRLNGRGGDTPNNGRAANSCSAFGGTPPPTLTITGGNAAGTYFSTASVNEPPLPLSLGPLPMALSQPAGACTAITSDVDGKIVIIDWTLDGSGGNECGSGTRAGNAIAANAAGIIFVAQPTGLLNLGSNSAIASVQVTSADGTTIKAGLPADATIEMEVGSDDSVAWLVGEDSTAPGAVGALRDMWTPGCFGDPGKVSDIVYACGTGDSGGVHTNSGVPNHAFAMLVDGGSYNGHAVASIGLTKANHIYFRAKVHYQDKATSFAAHADAVEQACADLIGTDLASLTDGLPSGEILTVADCGEVATAMLAVEMRTPPSQCGFQPLLAQDPPALCDDPDQRLRIRFRNNFERPEIASARWFVSNDGTTPDFTKRAWTIVSDLPDARPGHAFFGIDPTYGSCAPGGDETAVLHLDTPKIRLPRTGTVLRFAFDHWVATEGAYDGGNLKISVNDEPWQIVDSADFIYNAYNATLATAAQGNTNPLAGEPAFTGTDGGDVGGTWGRSIINLSGYASAGDRVQVRFDLGTDGCGGAFGWYVDDVTLYQCH